MTYAPAFVGYDLVRDRASAVPDYSNPDAAIVRQLDELERISRQERDKHLGKEYFSDIKSFYDLEDDITTRPVFRPSVRVPQLQTLVLNEATDITDSSPKIYITNDGRRDETRERYFQANWRQGAYNNRILESIIWAMLSNLGFIQIGFSARARRGRGMTWIASRSPESVTPDPFAPNDSEWAWVQWYDWMYVDEVRRCWPDKGYLVRPRYYAGSADPYGQADTVLDFPEYSPMSNQGQDPHRRIFRDNRVRVRHTYLFDNTRERVNSYAGSRSEALHLIHPRFEYTYPDGRWITDCEDTVLADGNNWCPQLPDDDRGTFPLVRIAAMPCISNFWGPAPIKLTRGLQHLSERLYTQTFENVVRFSNGVIVIDQRTGLDPNAFGWLPGEVLIINQGAPPPTVLAPQPLPQHMVSLPASLLSLQKELQGFSESRQGKPSEGNISSELFDATLWQSHYMTRLRGRLLSESLHRLAQIVFYIDARYKSITDRIPSISKNDFRQREWQPIPPESFADYDAYLDPGSLQIISAGAMRSVLGALSKSGVIPTKTLLEGFSVPGAEEIAEENMQEKGLAAMGKLKRPR